jgi:NAD(P)-dependent dehydrogenase (short-subunit alcohol dehydrogenase family)
MVFDVDLREPQAVEAIVSGTLERFGRMDALLNIAGAVPQIDLFEMTWRDPNSLVSLAKPIGGTHEPVPTFIPMTSHLSLTIQIELGIEICHR